MKGQVAILLLVNIFAVVVSYPNGAPSSANVCSKMEAGHGSGPQSGQAPYTISANRRSQNEVEVTIAGTQSFKGFYCQARDDSNSPVGQFVLSNSRSAQSGNCGNLQDNAATHRDSSDKKSVKLLWNGEDVEDDVTFTCTVLRDFDTYWTYVRARKLRSASFRPDSPNGRTLMKIIGLKNESDHRKSKVLNYNPYAPYPPYSAASNEYFSSEFVKNFQDPIPERPNFAHFHDFSYQPNRYENNHNLNTHSQFHQKPKIVEEKHNENLPHYYNPNQYKTAKPLLLQREPYNNNFNYRDNGPISPPSPIPITSGFIPNEFPPKNEIHHFHYHQLSNNKLGPNQHFADFERKPIEIQQFTRPVLSHSDKPEFSVIPNAGIVISKEFPRMNPTVPQYGVLVYNPSQGPPYYFFPTPSTPNHPEIIENKHFNEVHHQTEPFSDKHNDAEVIYGRKHTGERFFFGRKE